MSTSTIMTSDRTETGGTRESRRQNHSSNDSEGLLSRLLGAVYDPTTEDY